MELDKSKLPRHVAIIMDGNRRWAKKQGLALIQGHSYVVDELMEKLIDRCGELEIEYLTLWAFSTENWKRDQKEVEGVMKLFRRAIASKAERMIKKGARMKIIGDMSRFPDDIREGMRAIEEKSKDNTKITVVFALNYGGRDEILRAVNRLNSSEDVPSTFGVPTRDSLAFPDKERPQIAEKDIEKYLDTAEMPDPDLIIRPGGEKRLSGFLTWQSVYSELYFTDKLMPEFSVEELDKALEEYQERQRRFGK